jgi:prepilin-type N-terminal cleavage/methylation domain-containing protein
MRRNIMKKQTAFTLSEIMVTAAIVAAVAAFAVPGYNKAATVQNERACKNQLLNLKSANVIYKNQKGSFFDLTCTNCSTNDMSNLASALQITLDPLPTGYGWNYRKAGGSFIASINSSGDNLIQIAGDKASVCCASGSLCVSMPNSETGNCPSGRIGKVDPVDDTDPVSTEEIP